MIATAHAVRPWAVHEPVTPAEYNALPETIVLPEQFYARSARGPYQEFALGLLSSAVDGAATGVDFEDVAEDFCFLFYDPFPWWICGFQWCCDQLQADVRASRTRIRAMLERVPGEYRVRLPDDVSADMLPPVLAGLTAGERGSRWALLSEARVELLVKWADKRHRHDRQFPPIVPRGTFRFPPATRRGRSPRRRVAGGPTLRTVAVSGG